MSQLKLISERFSNISQYDQNTVQNLPTSVSTDAFESEYQLILPPLSGDKCITSYKYDSPNILQRLTTRRIEKHKNRLENWCEKLSEINEDAENQVIICCKTTADLLDASWERQKRLLNRNLANDQLLESEISDLESIWNQIDKEYAERRNAISNLENQLLTHERKRVDKIKEEFHLLIDYLSKYSHLPPNELQLFLQKEIFCIDIDLLENRRELANLTRNLHLAELINHRFTNLAWSNYRNHWQKINIDEAVRSFKVCINDVTFRHPTEVKTEIDNLSKKYTEYENDKEHLINEFCENVVPTNAIEEFLEKWNCKAKQLFTDWDETNQRCLNSIYKAYENNSQRWIDQIQQMKDRLLQRKLVNSSEEIENLIKVDCIPLLGELQSQFESNLNYLDQCFVWCVYIWPNGLIQPLLRYGQMVNKLWKQFAQEPINTVEKDLNNNLYSIQQIIFEEIKKKDEIINSSIDALRQCSNEQAINERLEETLNLFNDMKALYQTLNERQARIIDAYTKQVMNITDLCEIAVCRFFGVARCTKQQSLSLEKRIKQKSPVSGYLTLGYEQFICITQSESPEYTGDEIQNKLLTTDKINNTDHIFYHIKHRDIAVEDLVKNLQSDFKLDNQMNEFFIYLSKNLQYSGIIGNEINSNLLNNNSPVKLQSDKSFIEKQFNDPIQQVIVNGNELILVNKYIIDYVKPIKSEKCLKIIKDVKTRVRVKILEYLEQWKNTVTLSAKEESIVKRSENDNEYLMQIKLHESRIRRVKEDVANVRQAELVLHQTRIERHTTAVNIILNEMKINATKVLIETLNKSEERMNEEIQNAIDKVIAKATKSSTLLSLRKQVENYAAIHNERVRQALKTFRQELSNQVQTVNNSNLKLIESLKLFTDGGNFTLSEAKRYSFNLNELSKNVKLFEEETLGSIESIERERQLTIENRLKQFESLLKPYMADVIYLENMIRCVTNAQAQIKAQIEDSSSQMKVLSSQIEEFSNLLKLIAETNHHISDTLIHLSVFNKTNQNMKHIEMNDNKQLNGKEKVIQKELINKTVRLLTTVCTNASDRCVFLNCLRSQVISTKLDISDEKKDMNKQHSTMNNTSMKKEASSNEATIKMKSHSASNNQTVINSVMSEHTKGTENQSLLANVNSSNVMQISRPGRLYTEDACTQLVQSMWNECVPPGEKLKISGETLSNQLADITTSKGNDGKSRSQDEVSNLNKLSLDDNYNPSSVNVNTPTKSHHRDNNSSTTALGIQKTSRRKKNASHQVPNKTGIKHNRPQVYYDAFGKDPQSMVDSVEVGDSGVKHSNIEQVTFIGRIQKICRESLHNALHLSENYYKQKGIRQPTRPEVIKATFDDAASTLVKSLKTDFEKAETYRNLCIKEFSQQLDKIENLASQLPNLLFQDMVNELKYYMLNEIIACDNQVQSEMNQLTELYVTYSHQLNPDVCNPGKEQQLMSLMKKENDRHIHLGKLIRRIRNEKIQVILKGRQVFSQRLSKLTDYLFIRFDSLIGSDQIDHPTKGYETENLTEQSPLKTTNKIMIHVYDEAVSNLNENKTLNSKDNLDRGKRTWKGVRLSELLEIDGVESEKSVVTSNVNKMKTYSNKSSNLPSGARVNDKHLASKTRRGISNNSVEHGRTNQEDYCLVSAKTTEAHLSTLKCRDIAVEEFRSFTQYLMESIEHEFISAMKDSEERKIQWSDSVNLLSKLH